MSKTKRKSGYYWVQTKGKAWYIARWFSFLELWYYVAKDTFKVAVDRDFKQIDEKKIER